LANKKALAQTRQPSCPSEHSLRDRPFERWSEYPRFLEKTVKELKQPFWAWHSLRHRFASKLSREGKPLFEIMLLLGHSNLDTTQRYLQLLP
jgi:integrase